MDRATSAGCRLQADFLSLVQQYKEANRPRILESLPGHDMLCRMALWKIVYSILVTLTQVQALYNSSAPSAKLSQGTVIGKRDASDNLVYLGIPYAATTGGANRWRPPQRLRSSSHVWNATSYGATCPQAITSAYYSPQDEDCLNLNIWAPKNATEQPVYVYMYGGAMVTGSSSNPQLQGDNFARKGVVFVTFNTRESIWASPNSLELAGKNESQNFGILDVEMALEWIHDNIAGKNEWRSTFFIC